MAENKFKEEEISHDEARDRYGITTRHGRLLPSGEVRLRLLASDGTAYIQTRAAPNGGWQNAHLHKKVLETYIVQAGWVGYAEKIDDAVRTCVFRSGQCFTTAPHVIHNVYLPADAVIHTVKHGEGIGELRIENAETRSFTKITKRISEEQLLDRPMREDVFAIASPSERYGENYRHFDSLIWQASVWASGLFTLGLAGLTQIDPVNVLNRATRGNHEALLAAGSALFGAFILIISHALYRFRWHQVRCRLAPPAIRWRSPQFGLQTMVNLQAAVLVGLSLWLIGLPTSASLPLLTVGLAAIIVYQEGKTNAWLWKFGSRETRS